MFDEGQRLGFVQPVKSLDNAGLYGPAAVELLFELLQCRWAGILGAGAVVEPLPAQFVFLGEVVGRL